MIQRKLEVTYLPFDRSTRVPPGTTLFSAAHWIGLPIDSTCGGRGTCGKCKVRIVGAATEITDADHRELRQDEIAGGWRLSCQAHIHEDMTCEVPQLLRVPKAATMGLGRLVILDPNVRKVYFESDDMRRVSRTGKCIRRSAFGIGRPDELLRRGRGRCGQQQYRQDVRNGFHDFPNLQ